MTFFLINNSLILYITTVFKYYSINLHILMSQQSRDVNKYYIISTDLSDASKWHYR